ncbi:hypothetical protein B0H67DRAFT_677524 [Lasiosphaeris hirsuta]|uniref:Uncharacterized protein n=1 Tax=Lasiosphaeris hirsuta TaxID=260670 RepID=A0AA40E9W7_9PEZI|nr:hypothetical protein B0H67DRAFT_677524 [Lasiosphaeris hirsuta]
MDDTGDYPSVLSWKNTNRIQRGAPLANSEQDTPRVVARNPAIPLGEDPESPSSKILKVQIEKSDATTTSPLPDIVLKTKLESEVHRRYTLHFLSGPNSENAERERRRKAKERLGERRGEWRLQISLFKLLGQTGGSRFLSDFGITKQVHEATNLTSVVGTEGCMAPEVRGMFPLADMNIHSTGYTSAVDSSFSSQSTNRKGRISIFMDIVHQTHAKLSRALLLNYRPLLEPSCLMFWTTWNSRLQRGGLTQSVLDSEVQVVTNKLLAPIPS